MNSFASITLPFSKETEMMCGPSFLHILQTVFIEDWRAGFGEHGSRNVFSACEGRNGRPSIPGRRLGPRPSADSLKKLVGHPADRFGFAEIDSREPGRRQSANMPAEDRQDRGLAHPPSLHRRRRRRRACRRIRRHRP